MKKLTERQTSWLALLAMWLGLMVMAALRPLAVPDEGRYGEVGRWMLQSGDWMTPRLNGIPFFHKPPYLYWLQAMSLQVFGINELALRLVPALHVGLMLVALYLATRRFTNETIARRACIMLGTSLTFLIGGQYINHDMLVAAWIGVAIWCFAFSFIAGDRPHANLARFGFVACALGVLSKGLIGVALPGLVLFVWLLWTRQFKKVLYLPWMSGLALLAVIAFPWFVIEQRSFPELFNYMFVNHHFSRFTAKTFNNVQPWWFYVLSLALLLFPWVFVALGQWRSRDTGAGEIGQKMLNLGPLGSSAQAGQVANERAMGAGLANNHCVLPLAAWRLCWVWVLAILIFFSIPSSKLIGYILPVIPPLALLAAVNWQTFAEKNVHAGKLFVAFCAINVGVALGIVTQVANVTADGRTQDIAAILACESRPADTVYASGAFPYDLPFYAQTARPMVVLQDWVYERAHAGDGWQRELFEGAVFEPASGAVLQQPDVLVQAALVPGNWWVVPNRDPKKFLPAPGWVLVSQGAGFNLYKSAQGGDASASSAPSPAPLSALKGPISAQNKGLPGCKDHS